MAEHDLQSIAFPTLDDGQIAEFSRCARATSTVYRNGETLFAVGDRNFKFHVIKSGEVEILDYSGEVPKNRDHPSQRRVHRRYLAPHRQSLGGQRCCQGRLRSV